MSWPTIAGFVFGLLVVFLVGWMFGPSKELKMELERLRRKKREAELAARDAWAERQRKENGEK